ncbi:MAG: metal-dependent hydrolase [Aphanocapsa sp. GSE-SYN-MK-11-07L]|jgi:inner membrane protein|nr:metal-dependent hydrolase [Aphanocapsa sp. GSE-SYN-MK-11-07L]
MMNSTQAVFSVALTSLAMGTADPVLLGTAAIASQFPDLDTSKSWIGRLPPLTLISRWIEKRYSHRTLTHSFLFSLGLAGLTLPITLLNQSLWIALNLGYFLGWYADNFTKQGVCAFFPHSGRLVTPGNPRLRLSTGSSAEYFLLMVLVCGAIAIINLNTSGGILKAFNQTLGLSSGAVEIVAAEQNQYLLIAQIRGRNTLTQQAVQGQFEVVQPLTQTDLLVKDSQGKLYRAGETQESQILITQVQIQRQGTVKQSVQEIRLEDEAIADALSRISQSSRIYISGLLTVEDAEDLVPPNYPDRFNSIRVQPGSGIASVHLEAASPADVIRVLGDYSASGSLIVRSIHVQS